MAGAKYYGQRHSDFTVAAVQSGCVVTAFNHWEGAEPWRCRLDGGAAQYGQGVDCWCAGDNEELLNDTYLQVNLGGPRCVTGVGIKGRSDCDQWVTQFELHRSFDGVTWHKCVGPDGDELVLEGNENNEEVKEHYLGDDSGKFWATAVRMKPLEWEGWVSCKFEVYFKDTIETNVVHQTSGSSFDGFDGKDGNVGITNRTEHGAEIIIDAVRAGANVTAYNFFENADPWKCNLEFDQDNYGYGHGCWIPGPDENSLENTWIQVNFNQVENVTAIEMKGRTQCEHWITLFCLEYSFDGVNWYTYSNSDGDRVEIEGCEDNQGIIRRDLHDLCDKFLFCRSVRVKPLEWEGWPACFLGVYIKQTLPTHMIPDPNTLL